MIAKLRLYNEQLIEEVTTLTLENSSLRKKVWGVRFETLVAGVLIGMALAVVFVKLPGMCP